jgi:hypothetical protein
MTNSTFDDCTTGRSAGLGAVATGRDPSVTAPIGSSVFGFPASAACFEYLILNHVVVIIHKAR